jgi:predicted RNase H-like HicB family nuclease
MISDGELIAAALSSMHRESGRIDAEGQSEEDLPMTAEFTAVFRQVPEGYIAFVEELPGANTQGSTLEEARENLREAVQLVIEANRALAEDDERRLIGKVVL